MRRNVSFLLIAAAIMMVFSFSTGFAKEKIKLEKLDDLPRYTYQLDVPAAEFVKDKKAVLKLAAQLEKDYLSDLDTYEIEDKTTLKSYYSALGTIALLNERYDEYMKYWKMRQELEEKDAARMTSGLFTRAYIKAIKAKNFEKTFSKEYAKLVNDLPYDIVGDELKAAKGSTEIISENLVIGQLQSGIQPIIDENNGEMSRDIARGLVSSAFTLDVYLPHKNLVNKVLTAYIDKNKVEKEDIWEERNFALPEGQDIEPVVVAIWDSGVDFNIFVPLNQMFVNEDEIPGNMIDDDEDGFIDNVNGIAYDLQSNKTESLLYPIGDVEADRPRLQNLMKGLEDITSAVDSKEAKELKMQLSQLQPEEVKPFIEDISKYGNYAHGTHVAGIAAAGNPYVRILGARLTFGYKMIPDCPTIAGAYREAAMYHEVIDYFKANKVRVVNMSWGGNISGIEAALEANNEGGTPEERKELARKIFEIGRDALYDAFASAPEILFITSAGNSDNDVNFEEYIPSSFDLPNIISIGAVDQAGDETGFTSFGKVDVYANGFEVESYVPGGDRLPMSGTSMSSPNVTNLAGKLFTVNPNLTALEVRKLIEDASEVKMAGDREVKLIHPKKSLDMLKQAS